MLRDRIEVDGIQLLGDVYYFSLSFVTVCSNGDLRLVGGNSPTEGRVEICVNNVWGSVCQDTWGDTEAGVACQQAGFSAESATTATFGRGNNTAVYTVACTGTETRLNSCQQSPNLNCVSVVGAGVSCQRCKS